MTYRISFLSVWNSIKKIPSLLGGASDDYVKNVTVLPWLLAFIKQFLGVYKKNKRNSWEYLISCFQFKNLKTDDEKKCYLIAQFNASLLFYSEDKENPWIIDDKSKYFIKIKKKYCIEEVVANKLTRPLTNPSVHYSQTTESTKIHLPPLSLWEQANRFADKNSVLQLFGIIWDTVSSHANLLKWISFFLIAFSVSCHLFPLIVLSVAGLAVGYLILRCVFSFKKKSRANTPLLSSQEEERLIQCIKQDVFNKETYKKDFGLIQDQLSSSSIELTKVFEQLVSLKQIDSPNFLQQLQLEKSSIYQYLSQVYPKTQFIFSLVINFSCIAFYGYLVSWATSAFFGVIGAATLAGLVASPPGLAILISIPIIFFLVRHLIQSLSREEHYQKTIHSLLNATCEYSFTDSKGQKQQIELKKWEKFEYLQKKIRILETTIKKFLLEKNIDINSPLYLLFKEYSENKSNIYKLNDQAKTQRTKIPILTKVKKILNRLISFMMGGFYGYNLGQQIAVASNLGISILKVTLLSINIVIFPFIIINAIANLVTYHLSTRQKDRLFFAEYLDSKLQTLEYTEKELRYLCATLEAVKTSSGNEKTNKERTEAPEKEMLTKTQSSSPLLQTKFFRPVTTPLPNSNSLEVSHLERRPRRL